MNVPQLEGLSQDVIPITPVMKSFVTTKDGEKITVNRSQLPLTLAYAFTNYRSQGQTLQPVYIDIGSPAIWPLNAIQKLYCIVERYRLRQYPTSSRF